MRCDCCNRKLTDYESSLKSDETGEYTNTCVSCLTGLSIKVHGNTALAMGKEVFADDIGLEVDDAPWVFDTSDNTENEE